MNLAPMSEQRGAHIKMLAGGACTVDSPSVGAADDIPIDLGLGGQVTSDEDGNGSSRPKLGSGLGGRGPSLTERVAGKTRDFHDGSGLYSPGRWHPEMRNFEITGPSAELLLKLRRLLQGKCDLQKTFATLACGKAVQQPFGNEVLCEGRSTWSSSIRMFGARNGDLEKVTPVPSLLASTFAA